MELLRVLVVSGDPLGRAGLAMLLGNRDDLAIVGQLGPDAPWPAAGEAGAPDAVLLDLGLGTRSGLEPLREGDPEEIPVVAVAADEGEAREALAAGARGVVSREADGDRLAAALHAAAQGLLVIDEPFAATLAREAASPPPVLSEALTPRELEVLQLLSQGLPNKRIAARLGVSEHTVKFHVNAILGKLGVQSRSEAIVQALRLGLVVL